MCIVTHAYRSSLEKWHKNERKLWQNTYNRWSNTSNDSNALEYPNDVWYCTNNRILLTIYQLWRKYVIV